MPKARTPLDVDRYQELLRQGLSLRQIAKALGIPESTLRNNLQVLQKAQASQGLPQTDQGTPEVHTRLPVYPPEAAQGVPQGLPEATVGGHQPEVSLGPPQADLGVPEGTPEEYHGPPEERPRWPPEGDLGLSVGPHPEDLGIPESTPAVSLGPPQPDQAETAALPARPTPPPQRGGPRATVGKPITGLPEVHLGGPPLYIHPGISDSSEESAVGGEEVEEVHQGIPALPEPAPPQGDPGSALSPPLAEALTTAWPEIQHMLAWWRDRQRLMQDATAPDRQLERQTYHVEKRFIEAVRREADLTGESYAAIVNHAFAQYFAGKAP
jgi:hypothetical protein